MKNAGRQNYVSTYRLPRPNWSDARLNGFAMVLSARGEPCLAFIGSLQDNELSFEVALEIRWLHAAPPIPGELPMNMEKALLDRERARRDALVADDMEALAELMTDDLLHVHTTGIVNDKAQLIAHAGSFLRFINIERGPLLIRFLTEDSAVMTGTMTNTLRRRDEPDEQIIVKSFVTQIWVHRDGDWRCASFQATKT